MGKRITWFDYETMEQIQENKFDYTALFEKGKSKEKEDSELTKEEIIKKYRKIEKLRNELLKNESVGFGCP
jgi:hypothetical protein